MNDISDRDKKYIISSGNENDCKVFKNVTAKRHQQKGHK